MNRVFISGNITKDPELYSVENSEWSCISFSIANNDNTKKNKDTNEYEDEVCFCEMKWWTKTKKIQYWLKALKKGVYCCCDAVMKQERWEQDGFNRSKHVFMVQRFPEGLPRLEKSEHHEQSKEEFEDDIPF